MNSQAVHTRRRPSRFSDHGRENHSPTATISRTVLLIDDDTALLEIRRLLLEKAGYFALTVNSGMKALEVFHAGISVDAVVLDYLMPEMDGEQTAVEIRKLNRNVPIILATASLAVPGTLMSLITKFVPKGSPADLLIEALEQHAPLAVANGHSATGPQKRRPG